MKDFLKSKLFKYSFMMYIVLEVLQKLEYIATGQLTYSPIKEIMRLSVNAIFS